MADDEIKDGISQKLEPFVVATFDLGVLVDKRAVAQGFLQQVRFLETVGERFFQRLITGLSGCCRQTSILLCSTEGKSD
jgi:hypothetical protein